MVVKFGRTEDYEQEVGSQFKALRLSQNLTQEELAGAANISPGAVRTLEAGRGSSLATVIKVARVLGREDWLLDLHPDEGPTPLQLLEAAQGAAPRQRAAGRRRRSR